MPIFKKAKDTKPAFRSAKEEWEDYMAKKYGINPANNQEYIDHTHYNNHSSAQDLVMNPSIEEINKRLKSSEKDSVRKFYGGSALTATALALSPFLAPLAVVAGVVVGGLFAFKGFREMDKSTPEVKSLEGVKNRILNARAKQEEAFTTANKINTGGPMVGQEVMPKMKS